MKLTLQIEPEDTEKVRAIIASHQDDPFVKDRIAKNLSDDKPQITKDEFWKCMVAGDERLTGALLDRLTHRVHIVEIKGDSYRLKSSMKTTKRGTQSGGRTATKKQS